MGRKVDEEWAAVFYELCEWLDFELEHGVMTFDQVYRKLQQFDPSSDHSLTDSKKWLKKMFQDRYHETLQMALLRLVATIFFTYLHHICTVVDFTGAGRRCRFADNAGAPLLKYQPFTFSPCQRALTMWRWFEKRSLKDSGAPCSSVMLSLVVILFLQLQATEKLLFLTTYW